MIKHDLICLSMIIEDYIIIIIITYKIINLVLQDILLSTKGVCHMCYLGGGVGIRLITYQL